ncbi:MAG: xanthine dehydrogenase family protein molybdopterin-binding subunit, partial [Chloroflexi bacterium]|nr:xanthine dehydrogenase family protein molybdopterin-binding subunit [Chloroflexota bacterium]
PAVARAASPTAALQAGCEPGLEALEFYPQEKLTYSYGVHLALVEVDVETGQVAVQRYLADHDVGRAINPRLVEGQIVGGFAQGLGAALLEELAYDERGQLLAGTLADYLLPTAVEVPPIEVHVAEESPSTLNPLGVKGVGEEGVVAAGPALANAVADALAPLGVAIAALPLTPSRLRELVRASCASQRGTIFI